MITHIVLLQPKPETTEEEIHAILEQVKALKEKIPCLLDVQVGENRRTDEKNYRYGFIMRFVDEEHLKAYSPHPAHRTIAPELRRLCTHLLNFDMSEENPL